jgi:hypothetical protein
MFACEESMTKTSEKSTNGVEFRCKVVSDDFACVVYTGCVGPIEAPRGSSRVV